MTLPRRSARVAGRSRKAKPNTRPQAPEQECEETSPACRKTGILDLPPELRVIITRNLIHSKNGPEVYVGVGSRVSSDIIDFSSFKSPVTKTTEFARENAEDFQFVRSPERSWVFAYRALRPLMACKVLYYEATGVFFSEKHFVLGSSTYAHAWLRKIGQRNQVNLRNIRLKIHKEYTGTGDINLSGSQWIEVLRKVGRSARNLKVLGFQFDHNDDPWRNTLLEAFLRMKNFRNLRQIDLFHHVPPRLSASRELLAMMSAETGCPLVRCFHLDVGYGTWCKLLRQAFRDDGGNIHVSPDFVD